MSRLFLLRHARARWAAPDERDFDRPLSLEGTRQAAALGKTMHANGLIPDRIMCSSARRARQTWALVCAQIGDQEGESGKVTFTDELYSRDAAGYLELVRSGRDSATMLIIGHNPMIEELAMVLAGNGADDLQARLSSGFPAGAMALLDFDRPLAGIGPGMGYLAAFLPPGAAT